MDFQPSLLIAEAGALEFPFAQALLKRFKAIELIELEPGQDVHKLESFPTALSEGKKILFLKRFVEEPLKLCPGSTDCALCCNYLVLSLIENCPLECSYCILQAFLNRPLITLHVNVEEITEKALRALKTYGDRPLRVGTGEHSDSLALEPIFPAAAYLVKAFAKQKQATLELKTKTTHIQSLLNLDHQGRTVIAWSLNPPLIIKREEHKTPSLKRRLQAAAQVIKAGYQVAFHFDPVIWYPDWKQGYQETVDAIFEQIAPKDIAWISMGTFRYIPELKTIASERFENTGIFLGEFIRAEDKKMKYLKALRKEMIQWVMGLLAKRAGNLPLYLCMEKRSLWSGMPEIPKDPLALERYLNSNRIGKGVES